VSDDLLLHRRLRDLGAQWREEASQMHAGDRAVQARTLTMAAELTAVLEDAEPGRGVTREELARAIRLAGVHSAEFTAADRILAFLPACEPEPAPSGVTTRRATAIGLINAIRDLPVMVSHTGPPADREVAEEIARMILARLPEALAEAEPASLRSAEFERLSNGASELGHVLSHMLRTMKAARIEMLQNGPEKAMQWILDGLPDADDNPVSEQWDGKESAEAWLDRTAEESAGEVRF